MNAMYLITRRGDTEVGWEPSDPKSVARARRAFERYRESHALAFAVSAPGDEPISISEFDENASEIILTRPLVGG